MSVSSAPEFSSGHIGHAPGIGVCPSCLKSCGNALEFDVTVPCELEKPGVLETKSKPGELETKSKPAENPSRLAENWSSLSEAVKDVFDQCDSKSMTFGRVGMRQVRDLFELNSSIRWFADRDPAISAVLSSIQRDGAVLCTLSDVKRLASTVYLIGDFSHSFSRIRSTLPESAEFVEANSWSADEVALQMTKDREKQIGSSTGSRSSYIAVVLGPGCFRGDDHEQAIASELLIRWVNQWNQPPNAIRGGIVALSEDRSVQEVSRWMHGHGVPKSGPSVPIRLGTPVAGSYPVRLQIGGIDPGETWAESFWRLPVPGLEIAETVVRADGTVTLPVGDPSCHPKSDIVEQLGLLVEV